MVLIDQTLEKAQDLAVNVPVRNTKNVELMFCRDQPSKLAMSVTVE
jgi:hypothetical protein